MFPERVGRVLLDGVVNLLWFSTEETTSVWKKQTADTEKVYEGPITGCALAGPQGCSVAQRHDSAADVDAAIQILLQKAYNATRKNTFVPVTSADVLSQIASTLGDPTSWATFTNTTYPEALAAVDAESTGLSSASSMWHSLLKRQRRQMSDTKSYSIEAILCSDSVDQRGTTMEAVFEGVIASSRTSSRILTTVWPSAYQYCPFWPVRAVERYQGPFNRTLANQILVANNKYDPVTPLISAQALVGILGDDAKLVVQNGFGHTTNGSPSQCFDQIVFEYFTNGTLSESNENVCDVDTDFKVFTDVNTEDILASIRVA
ncbi:hypothetical protein PYCCODRAFT_660903 [Trametes coccinea BRFM310]|uniref:Peptidase S33 tripeptidyl aminopeptidase-like C-terminal domain-containing protein n=1 Tax=Trametes coccinea (strain BRFM310) TaxID=1353009 RepID=A0A1Y2IHX4_TRAC3|nr:hypothetical protein PYCCODRAFT_660903 [Trametes coccinea BRFM310]